MARMRPMILAGLPARASLRVGYQPLPVRPRPLKQVQKERLIRIKLVCRPLLYRGVMFPDGGPRRPLLGWLVLPVSCLGFPGYLGIVEPLGSPPAHWSRF